MATPAQIAANQANAAHSTVPRTPAGKARAAPNALRRGLTARHLVIRDGERDEFAALQSSLLEELAPEGAAEIVTFHELIHAAWSLQRFRRLEAEASPDLARPQAAAYLDRLTRALAELRTLQTNGAIRNWKIELEAEPEVPAIADINELTKPTRSEVPAEGLKLAIQLVDIPERERKAAGVSSVQAG